MKRALARFAAIITKRPWLTLVLMMIIVATALGITSSLRFDTSFAALLPQNTEERIEVEELLKRAGGTVELVIALRGDDQAKRLAFGKVLAKGLQEKSWIRTANVEYPVDFFLDRQLYFLSLKELEDIDRKLADEVKEKKKKANPLYIDLEDDDDGSNGKNDAEKWRNIIPKKKVDADILKRSYTSPDNKYLFVRVKPAGTSYNMRAGKKLLAQIKSFVQSLRPESYSVSARYAGGLEINQEQHQRMSADMKRAAISALILIVLLVAVYMRCLTAPIILALPLVSAITITLAITTLLFGQLNLVSGLLVSALFGLGVDFEIHLYLRFLEALERGKDRLFAIKIAIQETFIPAMTGALTTAAAFFAISISSFRGFREYGIIAGIGVSVTLIVTFITLPPLALYLTRSKRAKKREIKPPTSRALFRTVIAASVILTIFSIVAPKLRWHNDFRALRGVSEKVDFSLYVGEILGGDLSPAAIYVDTIKQARKVKSYLKKHYMKGKDAAIRAQLSLADMLPLDMAKKETILKSIKHRLRLVDESNFSKKDREDFARLKTMLNAAPWTEKDVPLPFKAPVMTVDGQGLFVVVWPTSPTDIDKDIIEWGDSLTKMRKELHQLGIPVKIMDENRLGAKVLKDMAADAPMVLIAAALVVVVLLIIHFRRLMPVVLVVSSLSLGLLWMVAFAAYFNITLNVFNQAVLATIVGVGIDNAIHLYHRYLENGRGSMPCVWATTGSAAILASVTTAIGFGTAISAHHLGLRSFGVLALVGISSTFFASTFVLPALISLKDRYLFPNSGEPCFKDDE